MGGWSPLNPALWGTMSTEFEIGEKSAFISVHTSCGRMARLRSRLARAEHDTTWCGLCQLGHGIYAIEHSNSDKKSFDSIRFGNLINLPLVH